MSKGDIKWWFEPGNGQKWGWILPNDLIERLRPIYGMKSPSSRFAEEIGVAPSTVVRWVHGTCPMPKLPALYLALLEASEDGEHIQPTLSAPWLPESRSTNGAAVAPDGALDETTMGQDSDPDLNLPYDDYDPDWAPPTDHTGLVLEDSR